jgi:hypothetical protein
LKNNLIIYIILQKNSNPVTSNQKDQPVRSSIVRARRIVTFEHVGLSRVDLYHLQEISDTYYAGSVAKYLQLRIKCKDCIDSVLSEEFLAQHLYCQFKEYDDFTSRLLYTKPTFASFVGRCLRFHLSTVQEFAHEVNLTASLCLKFKESEQARDTTEEEFGCPDHRIVFKTQLENFILNTAMKWFAKSENSQFKQDRKFVNLKRTKIRVITVKVTAAAAYRMQAIKKAVKR